MGAHNILDQLIQKQAELSGLVATLANEGRAANEDEKGKLQALKTDIDAIKSGWESDGRRAFLAGIERKAPREGMVLKSSESFADVFKGEYDSELEGMSLGRMVRGIATGNWKGAELELKTAMSSSATAGGYLIPDVLSTRVIDLARNKSFVIQAGAGTIPMTTSNLSLATVDGDPTVDWYGENATIGEASLTFGRRLFTARKMAAICRVSNELLEDAQNIDSLIQSTLANVMALELDRVSLFGNGVGEPLGVNETSGVNTSTSVGTPASYDKFVDAVYSVRAYNYEPNAVMYSPRTAQTLAKMVTGLASDKTKLVPPADFLALQKYSTNQIPNTLGGGAESVAFVGDWRQYVIGLRSDIRLEVSRVAGTAFEKDQTLIRVVWRGDGLLLQPRAFTVMSGITA
jgi:HK97 family phage major capsid protein